MIDQICLLTHPLQSKSPLHQIGTIPISQPITFHATKSGGNICSQSLSLIFGAASVGIQAFVSNRSPHFVQVQRLRTKRSLTNSDHSGAISASLHLTHVVVMATLLCVFSFSASKVGVF